jgi:hypothetical protein
MNWLWISLVDVYKAMHGLVKMPLFYGTIIIALLIFSPVLYAIYHNNNERLSDLAYASKNSNSLDQSNNGISYIGTQGIKDPTTSLSDSIKKSVDKLIIEANGNGQSYSGKIASSQINPNNGKVEKVLFGNWTLDSKPNQGTKFLAKFTMTKEQAQSSTINKTTSSLSSSTTAIEKPVTFIIDNLKANSVQRANEDLTLGGTVDISEHQGNGGVVASKSWKNIPVTISITNHASNLIITFDKNSPAALSKEFSDLLLTGVVTSKSGNNNASSGSVNSQIQTH